MNIFGINPELHSILAKITLIESTFSVSYAELAVRHKLLEDEYKRRLLDLFVHKTTEFLVKNNSIKQSNEFYGVRLTMAACIMSRDQVEKLAQDCYELGLKAARQLDISIHPRKE